MSYHISEILLDDEKYQNYEFIGCKENKKINNLSKVNIFVGANNSGKSRMLRELFQEDGLKFIPADIDISEINNVITEYKRNIISILDGNHMVGYGNIEKDEIESMKELEYILANEDFLKYFDDTVEKSLNLAGTPSVSYSGFGGSYAEHSKINRQMKEMSLSIKERIETVRGVNKNYKFRKVYIPTLRGLRGFENNENYYLNRTKKDYFPSKEVEIFTGLDLYEEVKKLLLGSLEDREKIADFQKFLGESFFDGQKVTLIPSINSDVLHVKIGDEKEQPVYKLGDGIQSLIILTFPLFKYREEKLLLFIEEPELYLHPGMQRKFLDIVMSGDFEGFQYFITSHSNHFLDITLDMEKISIYSFGKELETKVTKEKNANFIVENVSNEENNVLQMLGVRNSAVLLSNCTIWVEGITDRYYIRHFLNIYQKSLKEKQTYKEDIHYSFVEYSGNNITHWSFLDEDASEEETFSSINESRVCGTLFLITDKDSKKKEKRQQKLAEKLQERYYCLDCKEIENLLSVQTLRKVIASYEKVDETTLDFKSTFTERSYKNKSLGTFIDENLNNSNRRGSYASASGTVSDKVEFCKRAISFTGTINDLSAEAKRLCEKLYEFIAVNNR
ncbi:MULTISPECIES: AAA family ATPase [Bacillus cereus group]|uniref:AAA family ATPase n=1 Tax=Bacillus cereus group TaxID=86661 RepID=UPI00178C2C60|nr:MULTISPECIES: ATP-binding protein [Bacillus cereus group]